MSNSKQAEAILIVEGEADRGFFEQFCLAIDLQIKRIALPKELGDTNNGKQGVFKRLPDLLPLLAKESVPLKKLAIVVDADQIDHGKGFDKAMQQITEILKNHNYTTEPLKRPSDQGLIFKHNDGLADFGVWIMPDNQTEGTLENWIGQCISPKEQELYAHAQQTVTALKFKKFEDFRRPKADVATWLAWQEFPGEGLYGAVKRDLLNKNAPLYVGFRSWLEAVFK